MPSRFLLSSDHNAAAPPSVPIDLKPQIAAVVAGFGVLFSLIFTFVLYTKYCSSITVIPPPSSSANNRFHQLKRKSGVDRRVVESLPLFRFSAVAWRRTAVECAVCLCRFRGEELLRLLPKCKHAFHVECVDTWLDEHSTCPLCRYRVDPEDVLLAVEGGAPTKGKKIFSFPRISGRHSSAGETEKSFQIILENDFDGRVSLDSWYSRRKMKNSEKRRDAELPVKGNGGEQKKTTVAEPVVIVNLT